jgi:hypothetical protein
LEKGIQCSSLIGSRRNIVSMFGVTSIVLQRGGKWKLDGGNLFRENR